MEIKRLSWDSGFFGIEVFAAWVRERTDAPELVARLKTAGAELAYIFLQIEDKELRRRLPEHGAILYDEKTTYAKTPAITPGGEDIETYQGPLTDDLLQLAFLAGHESRFRKDPRLAPFFEPLYRLWIGNSLDGTFASKVFVCRGSVDGVGGSGDISGTTGINGGTRIEGMVTCKLGADGQGSIGLIATDTASQGRGIGSRLVRAADSYFAENGATAVSVVTQASNTQACRFYENAGFSLQKLEHVYHLWLN